MVDAQGYDHRVIEGASRIIEHWHPFLLVEFWPPGIMAIGDDPDEVLRRYRSLGYRVELLPHEDVSECSAEEILRSGPPSGRDHTTLSLVPV
jgi:hypothetical protein